MLLVIDNYDSFTFNLVQYLGELGATVRVERNDAPAVRDVAAIPGWASAVVLSPGPCTPNEAGVSLQVIGQAFGGKVIRARAPMHGKISAIQHRGLGVFAGLPQPMQATRYHSLIVERATLPACLEITAETAEGEIMGLRHREHAVEGVQFHPESIMTPDGKQLLANFLRRVPA